MLIARMSFPFGRPDGALKSLLTLLETVLYRDAVTPPTTKEVREVVGRCLENAACNSYTKLTTDNLDGEIPRIYGKIQSNPDKYRIFGGISLSENAYTQLLI